MPSPERRATHRWSRADLLAVAKAAPFSLRPAGIDLVASGPTVPLGRRWLVVSPHLDDAVLSLGAAISQHVRTGGSVTVCTVLAGDPHSTGPASPHDWACGFADEADAARSRREEDVAALELLGASAVHLDGADDEYPHGRPPMAMGPVVAAGVDELLLPGHPLSNGDHAWVAETAVDALAGALLTGTHVRFYAEEPYATNTGYSRRASWAPTTFAWERLDAGRVDQLAKLRSMTRYVSQVPVLARHARLPFSSARMLGQLWSATRRGEWVSAPVPIPAPAGAEGDDSPGL